MNPPAAPAALRSQPMTSTISDARTSGDDHVVLLDPQGRAVGSARKLDVHGSATPFHLATSCYVVRGDGRLLLTRRSAAKLTWPGSWTNACCGHPRPGEQLADATTRHMRDEIGLAPLQLRMALPDFTYRATMPNGWVEHELCPVYIAEVDGEPTLDPSEADAMEWVSWTELAERARDHPESLSPWCVEQVSRIGRITNEPLDWVRAPTPSSTADRRRRTTGLGGTGIHSDDPFLLMGDRVDRLIDSFIDQAEAAMNDLDPLAVEVCAPIRSLVRSGGKRLRPCLVHCGLHVALATQDAQVGSTVMHDAAHAAAAVEMLHTFALLHDDVMDRSALRRGRPTAHVHYANLHTESGSTGDADWFGASAAILAGDLAFVWADELLDRMRCNAETARRVRTIYSQLRNEVIAGQYLDMRLAGPAANDQQALTVALLKSARYTVTRPLEIGAALGGADEAVFDALRRYGDAIGVAFQLRDDVLGVYGDSAATGKGGSEDLRSGKSSLLLVRALDLAPPRHRQTLLDCLGASDIDDANIDRCREAVDASGARASIEALIEASLDEARRALACLPPDAAGNLDVLAELLVHRTA